MSKSFDITNSGDYFEQLVVPSFEELQKQPTSSRAAITAAIFCWHLRDWVWAQHKNRLKEALGLRTFDDLAAHLVRSCPAFEAIQGIANGSKHFRSEQHEPTSTTRQWAVFGTLALWVQHVLDRRITNEKQVVYLMVELRKLMDRENYKDPVLRTFSNWVVHTSLSYPQEVCTFLLNEFDHLMTDMFEHKKKSNQLEHVSLTEFRVALHRCFQQFGLVGNFVKNGGDWKKFVHLYCSIVSECPIVFTASKNKLKYIKQVGLRGVSRFHKEWKSVDWRLTFHDGRTMNWGFVI